jgi:hypothetical protein
VRRNIVIVRRPQEAGMSIAPFLSKQAFDPEVTEAMGAAFDAVCRALAIDPKSIAEPRIVARKIIELAQMGVRDADQLRDRALDVFQNGTPYAGDGRKPPSGPLSPR